MACRSGVSWLYKLDESYSWDSHHQGFVVGDFGLPIAPTSTKQLQWLTDSSGMSVQQGCNKFGLSSKQSSAVRLVAVLYDFSDQSQTHGSITASPGVRVWVGGAQLQSIITILYDFS